MQLQITEDLKITIKEADENFINAKNKIEYHLHTMDLPLTGDKNEIIKSMMGIEPKIYEILDNNETDLYIQYPNNFDSSIDVDDWEDSNTILWQYQ